jgi:predicted DsbA family dithiol-disulfide isomerase
MRELAVWMSKNKLKAMHEVALRNRLEHLRRRQRDEAVRVQEDLAKEVQDEQEAEAAAARAAETAAAMGTEDGSTEPKKVPEVVREAWTPDMEPKTVARIPMEDRHLEIVDPEKELADLVGWAFYYIDAQTTDACPFARRQIAARRLVAQARFVPKKTRGPAEPVDIDAGDVLAKAAASKGLDEDEEVWNAKDEQQHQTYSWQDKYRPRKPRYFNKVITGFDWNKYNQTHYE